MTDDEERKLARDMGRDFGIPGPDDYLIISDVGPAFLWHSARVCGVRPAECSLMQSERLNLFFLLYQVRDFNMEENIPSLEKAMAVAIEGLTLRGASMAKAALLVSEAALDQDTDLVTLVDRVGRWPELTRWEEGSE